MTEPCGPWKALVFDFDGTLAELNIDFAAMRAAILRLTAAYRIPPEDFLNLRILEMVEKAGEILAAQDPPERKDAFLQEARTLIERIELNAARKGSLFAESKMLLTELERLDIAAAVVTRNCRAAVLKVFPDIDRYCKAVVTREDAGRVKPHPDHLLAALNILAAVPGDAAMVGDHPIDIHLGKSAGAFTIGVLTGHSGEEELLAADADLILAKAPHILNYLS